MIPITLQRYLRGSPDRVRRSIGMGDKEKYKENIKKVKNYTTIRKNLPYSLCAFSLYNEININKALRYISKT